jgi:L-threonylcarbamoyladenylate synthase
MQIIKSTDPQVIQQAVQVLAAGGLVIYPTETCYGVGVLATDTAAVTKMLSYKNRPVGKAISIAVVDQSMADHYVEINAEAKRIYQQFLPGPVTVISKSRGKVAKALEAENSTLGVRIPDYDLIRAIVAELGQPITATSANLSGDKTPYKLNDILDNLSAKRAELVDLIIDAGELPHNPPSVVIDTTLENAVVYRTGSIKFESKQLELSASVEDTVLLGTKLVAKFKGILGAGTLVLMLNGSLGSGKTHFAKGVGQELGIKDVITSPSYTYLHEYDHQYIGQPAKLIHLDPWRINELSDFLALQPDGWFAPGNVVVIEWASRFDEAIQQYLSKQQHVSVVSVDLEYTQVATQRKIIINY